MDTGAEVAVEISVEAEADAAAAATEEVAEAAVGLAVSVAAEVVIREVEVATITEMKTLDLLVITVKEKAIWPGNAGTNMSLGNRQVELGELHLEVKVEVIIITKTEIIEIAEITETIEITLIEVIITIIRGQETIIRDTLISHHHGTIPERWPG